MKVITKPIIVCNELMSTIFKFLWTTHVQMIGAYCSHLSRNIEWRMFSHEPFRDEHVVLTTPWSVILHSRILPCCSPKSGESSLLAPSDKNWMLPGARPWPYTVKESLKIKTAVNVPESTGSDEFRNKRNCCWGPEKGRMGFCLGMSFW